MSLKDFTIIDKTGGEYIRGYEDGYSQARVDGYSNHAALMVRAEKAESKLQQVMEFASRYPLNPHMLQIVRLLKEK